MIRVNDICKTYGKKQVLKDINLEAHPGEIVSIVGANGCGKTTLLQILSGVIAPDSGSINIFEKNALKEKKTFEKYVGFVPQDNPLLMDLSVKDNLDFFACAVKEPDYSLLKDYDLEPLLSSKVSTLSGGMKRRLSIVCAMIGKHPILILDEPTSSLDMYYQESIMNSLIDFKKKNGIIVYSTHNPDEILKSDVCFLFDSGTLIRYNKNDIDVNQIRNKIKQ